MIILDGGSIDKPIDWECEFMMTSFRRCMNIIVILSCYINRWYETISSDASIMFLLNWFEEMSNLQTASISRPEPPVVFYESPNKELQ